MKRNIILATMLFAAGSLMAADPKDDVSSAVKSLADGGNYSWTQTMENAGGGGFGNGTSEGKTKDGLIYTSRTFNDNTFEILVKGTNSAMNNGQDGWQTAAEIAAAAEANGGGGGGGGFRGGNMARFVRTPTTTIKDVLDGVKELKQDGDAYVGDLTEDGAKSLATFGRRGRGGGGGGGFTPPEVTDAKGSVKFWIKDGKLSRYQYKVTGKTTDRDGNPMDIDRTTTVEIKDVGTTKITVPDDILKKIGG
ncbi:MAG TPA: hypothetical protein VN048_15545 [Verrucomicrobiae bacterium]|nr:hypothetical protein [Verrucomicrobiae bacterium]